jgi:hypothetical protein
VTVDGVVGGDLVVEGGSLTIGPQARIEGEVQYQPADRDDDDRVSVSPQARLSGGGVERGPREGDGDGFAFPVFRLLAFLLCGAIVVGLFPHTVLQPVAAMTRRPGASLGFGLLYVLLVPVVVILAAATVIGIPMSLIAGAFFLVALYLAPVVPSLWIGGALLTSRGGSERREAVLQFLLGGLIVGVILLLPWVGWVARLAVSGFGLGALALAIQARRVAVR